MIGLAMFALGFVVGIFAVDALEEWGVRKSHWRSLYFGVLAERERERAP